MGRQLGRCKKCNCQATIEERDNGVCIWCSARKLENEDISWLLNEISALRDELARVKVESLRVVYMPDDHPHMGEYYMTPSGVGWNSNDRHGDSCVETPEGYHQFKECRKVKLERWEDE